MTIPETKRISAPPSDATAVAPDARPDGVESGKPQKVCGQDSYFMEREMPTYEWAKRGPTYVSEQVDQRVRYLLKNKYHMCPDPSMNDDEGRNRTGSYPNCIGTMLWVLGIDPSPSPRNFGGTNDGPFDACDTLKSYDDTHGELASLIITAGYEEGPTLQAMEDVCERKNQWGYCLDNPPRKVNRDSFDNLKPGDALLFGTNDSDSKSGPFMHAAVYVGKNSKGEHVIFEKPSLHCGPMSPYRYNTLENLYKGLARSYIGDDYGHLLHVYRRTD